MVTQFNILKKTVLSVMLRVCFKAVGILILVIFLFTNTFAQENSPSDSPSVTKTSLASGNWSLATNWSPAGVPSATDDVIINHNILVDLSNASCTNLMINSGGKLGLNADFSLSGNFTNDGALVNNSGLITFNGNAIQYLLGSAASVFYNVVINNTAGVCINAATLTTIDNNLTINSGKKLLINPDKFLTVNGTIYNNYGGTNGGVEGIVIRSTADGSGSLIHNTDNVPATVERFILGDVTQVAQRYHQVSIPLNSSANPVSGLFEGSYLFRFDESAGTTGDWVGFGSSTSIPLNVNNGYLIYYVQPSGSMVYNFEGQMRNGTVRFPDATGYLPFTDLAHGYSLVPNPYPSAIDWRATSGWTKTQINNAIYIWNPDKNQYASYVAGAGNNGGSRYIAQGQSFFIHAKKATASLTVNNNARIHLSNSTQPFFKSTEEENLNLLKLEASVLQETDETAIRFIEDATEQFDSELDAMKFWGGTDAPQLASISSDNQKLSINSLPFNSGNRIVPLEFTFTKSAEITLTASGIENFASSLPIYLEDILLNKTIDMRLQPVYKFNHAPGQKNRFRLRFDNTNSKDEIEKEKVFVFYSSGKIHIEVPEMQGKDAIVQLFDVTGRLSGSFSATLNGAMQVDAPSTKGIYIIRMLVGNTVFTNRIIVN